MPDTNSKFWHDKLSKNISRDVAHQQKLVELGWRVIVIWECELELALKTNQMDGLVTKITGVSYL